MFVAGTTVSMYLSLLRKHTHMYLVDVDLVFRLKIMKIDALDMLTVIIKKKG